VEVIMTSTVGVLGAGTVGRGVSRFFLAVGYPVLISNSHGPETLGDVVADLGGRRLQLEVEEVE
jgi:3-hydroxyacyl-CoA dehydrogenase